SAITPGRAWGEPRRDRLPAARADRGQCRWARAGHWRQEAAGTARGPRAQRERARSARCPDRLGGGEHPPPGAQHALQLYISRLRKTLDPAGERQVVLTSPGAYLLRASADSVDIRRFERLAEEGRSALTQNEPDRAAADLREALGLWRSAPLADVSYEQFAQPEIARLNELRMGIT